MPIGNTLNEILRATGIVQDVGLKQTNAIVAVEKILPMGGRPAIKAEIDVYLIALTCMISSWNNITST